MRFALIICLLLLPQIGAAQGAATLVADSVTITPARTMIAQGNVEVFYDGTRLSADRVEFDGPTDQLRIDGAIVITTSDGVILTARQAQLDPTLENGVLRSARLVLDQQLQIAANQLDRRAGRYSQLYKVAATSCQICDGRPPLWEIRAKKVIHDEQAKQLYFTGTQFLIRGVPVFYLPQMRLPDPTLARSSGFLIPQLSTTDRLSSGIKVPYFIKIGDARDLTLTPYVSSKTTTLEWRYRQAFVSGDISIEGAISNDSIYDDARAYVFAEGQFDLLGDYSLDFDVEAVSDQAYLLDYGYASKDRLDSAITLSKIEESRLFIADLTAYQTLRDDEINAALPPVVGNILFENRIYPDLQTSLTLQASADTAYRYGLSDGDSGRDVTRIGASADLARSWVIPIGVEARAQVGIRGDIYQVTDDPAFDASSNRIAPYAALTLRYPLATPSGPMGRHLITPTVSFAYSDVFGGTPPNEDSTRAELDQSSLFAIDRFAGDDAVEVGARAAFGVDWMWAMNNGAKSTLTFGRVVRDVSDPAFNTSSGLSGRKSDWLLAGQVALPNGVRLEARSLLNDQRDVTLGAAKVGYIGETFDLNAAYIWQEADLAEDRADDVSEITLDSNFQVSSRWKISADTRYDIAKQQPARARMGVQYKNECVTVDLSVARRYTSSTTVEPSTSYGLSVSLSGFSAGRSANAIKPNCS